MLKLLLGVGIEIFVAVLFAGLVLALVIPLLNRGAPGAPASLASGTIMAGVLVSAVVIALFRPGSAIRRYMGR